MAYDYLRHYFEFMAREPGTAWCILTSAQAASGEEGNQRYGIVSYGRGQFSLRGVSSENVMYARLKQYFSDRTHGSEANPFDPQALDEVGVEVAFDPSAREVTVDLIAHSWGDGRQTLENLRVESGVVVGDGESIGGQVKGALYTLSLGTWLFA